VSIKRPDYQSYGVIAWSLRSLYSFKHILLENKHGIKAGTVKTEDISSSKAESATQLESKAANSVNTPQIYSSHYRKGTDVKDQERIMQTRRW